MGDRDLVSEGKIDLVLELKWWLIASGSPKLLPGHRYLP